MSDLIAPVRMLRWDTGTLTWVSWDGSLTTGALVIGAVTQSGTWTVQPGNTANTTAWKVDGSAVTQPVSGTFWQTTQPVSQVTGQGRTLLFATIAQSVAGTTQLVAADATKKIKVVSYVFTLSLAGTVKFTGTADLTGAMTFAANGGASAMAAPSAHFLETAVNAALSIVSTVGAANGHISYFLEV